MFLFYLKIEKRTETSTCTSRAENHLPVQHSIGVVKNRGQVTTRCGWGGSPSLNTTIVSRMTDRKKGISARPPGHGDVAPVHVIVVLFGYMPSRGMFQLGDCSRCWPLRLAEALSRGSGTQPVVNKATRDWRLECDCREALFGEWLLNAMKNFDFSSNLKSTEILKDKFKSKL